MVNLNDTWDGEELSSVREFIQSQLKKGFVKVDSVTMNGKVVLTFTKADGTTTTAEFTAAEDSGNEGYRSYFTMKKRQSVYGTGSDVTFSYTFTQTLDGEDVIGIVPNIAFTVHTLDNLGTPVKQLYATSSNAVGTNTVTIPKSVFDGVEGNVLISGNAVTTYGGIEYAISKQIIVSIATCDINFGPSFDLSKHVKGYAANGIMNEVFVDYVGTNDGELLVYIDGILRNTVSPVESGVSVEITYNMDSVDDAGEQILSTGLHTMQIVAKMDTGGTDDNGDTLYIYSKSLLFDFYKGVTGNHVGIQLEFETSDVINDPINSLTLTTQQYVNTDIRYAASSYNSSSSSYLESTAVSVSKGSTIINNLVVGNSEVFTYTFRDTQISNYVLTFAVSANSRKINISVNKNASGVAVASGANIDISAAGRNNLESASKINKWTFQDNTGTSYTGTLENFTFKTDGSTVIDGWDGEGLIFRGNTTLNFPYKPFAKFSTSTGYYIEFNFKVDVVLDSDVYILSAFNEENKGGFYLKAEEAGIITETGTMVSTPIAAGNYYNVGFMVKQYEGMDGSTPVQTVLLELFVNGIRSGVVVYQSGDSFYTDATISMNGLGAVWKMLGMRVYNTVLSPVAIYNNYLTTLLDADQIVSLADENDVLNNAKTAVDYTKLISKGKNVLIIEVGDGTEQCALDSDLLGKMLDECVGTPIETRFVVTKDQFLNPSAKKKDNFLVKSLTYYNNGTLSDAYSFKTGPTLLQVQGTSSTYYSRKNYDIFFTGQKYNKNDGSTKNWTASFDTNVGSSTTGANTTEPLYSMSAEDQGVPCLCLKADYSDSSNLHNTVLTKLINDVWYSLGEDYMTPPQHNHDTGYDKIRVGINGHPIDVFVKDGTDYIYIGQYNMNNEKKDSHHVFGFTAGSGNPSVGDAICIEFLENNRTATLFNAGADFDWENCSDTVDESGNAIPQLEFRYPGYDWVEAPVNLKSAGKRPFIWVKECYEDWVNSYNEDTGEYTSSKFVEELTQYFNPKNLVSWYLITEYFMMVDQRSKNMMMASWDATADSGIWYFLPYDSDTALGGTNDGWLILPWDSDENTPNPKDPTQYAFMGHDSNLWKLVRFYLYDATYTSQSQYGLEGCSMQDIAAVLRNEAVNNVLMNMVTINNAIGASRNYWPDIVYNFDADTKYIAPLTYQSGRGSKSDFAQFVQGARDAHRDWLINKRFRLLDSKYAAGHFITDEKNMKLSKDEGVAANMIVSAPNKSYVQLIVNTRVVAKQQLEADVSATLDITAFALGSNDPFKLQGFSAVESIDFNTIAPYIYSDATFPSSFTNLKKVSMVCPNNDGLLAENVGGIIKSLPNIREFTMKGYPNVTGVLDLSNNIMLEKVDVDCEGLSNIILPYSHFNLTYFNVGKLNEWVPWEFWDELNDYYARTQNSCIFVGELIDSNVSYPLYSPGYTSFYYINERFFVYIFPGLALTPDYYNKGSAFGASGAGSSTIRSNTQASYLKGIIYAKADNRLLKTSSGSTDWVGYQGYRFGNCINLEYVNTKGWYSYNQCVNSYGRPSKISFSGSTKLKTLDLTYVDSGTWEQFPVNFSAADVWPNNNSTTNGTLEYVRYGTKWFLHRFVEFRHDTSSTENATHDLCKHNTLNAQTFIDLAEDLPDASQYTFANSAWNALSVGDTNYNDYTKFPQSVRDKITAKGWIVQI